MNTIHWGTTLVAMAMVAYGFVGIMTGWADQAAALTLVGSGLGMLGITRQNITLGRAMGAYKK